MPPRTFDILVGTIVLAAVAAEAMCAHRTWRLIRRRKGSSCRACGYNLVASGAIRCPECGCDAREARRASRAALFRSATLLVVTVAAAVVIADLAFIHLLAWRRAVPNTVLLLLRREFPWLRADEELQRRIVRDYREIVWWDYDRLWSWQWRLADRTRAVVGAGEEPSLFDQAAAAYKPDRVRRLAADLPLFREQPILLNDLHELQARLGLPQSTTQVVGTSDEPSEDVRVVVPHVHRVHLDGVGIADDLVVVIGLDGEWWRQAWVLRAMPSDANRQSVVEYEVAGWMLIQADPWSGPTEVLDLGRGQVLLGGEAIPGRGTGICLYGRVWCSITPDGPDRAWTLPTGGYTCGSDGVIEHLENVDWKVERSAQGLRFLADLRYRFEQLVPSDPVAESDRPAVPKDHSIRVAVEQVRGRDPRINPRASGMLVGDPPVPVPGMRVPRRIGDLWYPIRASGY